MMVVWVTYIFTSSFVFLIYDLKISVSSFTRSNMVQGQGHPHFSHFQTDILFCHVCVITGGIAHRGFTRATTGLLVSVILLCAPKTRDYVHCLCDRLVQRPLCKSAQSERRVNQQSFAIQHIRQVDTESALFIQMTKS